MDYFAKFIDRNWPAFLIGALAGYLLVQCSGKAKADDTAVINASLNVRVPGASASGVAIAPHLVATNSHVVDHRLRNDVTVTDVHGQRYQAVAVSLDRDADVAILYVRDRSGPYVRIAPRRRPLVGLTLRLFGWGPTKRLSQGRGVVVSEWQRNRVPVVECAVHSEPGDSGGGLFNDHDELVALNWGGDALNGYSASTPAEYVRQVAEAWIVEALPESRWQEYQCLGGRCGSGPHETAGSARGVAPPKWPVAPPSPDYSQAPPTPIAPPPRPTAPPVPAPSPAIDTDQLVSQIVSKLATDERFKGPPGPPGKDGRDGKDGQNGATPKVDQDAIVAAVLAKIDLDEIASRVPKPTQPDRKVHYVVVGDESVAGWDRTQAAVRQASAKFRGVTTAEPPANYTGQLPVVVKYTNGIPEYVARGSYQVEQALGALSRGQAL